MITRGQPGVASLPVSGSMSTKTMPSGASNGDAGACRRARAFMNCVQIGSAACAPRQADRLVVVEADPDDRQQLGREADEPGVAQIVGRAGLARGVEREPGARAPAPVPSLMTLRIMLVTRNVVSGRATSRGRRRLLRSRPCALRSMRSDVPERTDRRPCSGRSCRPWRSRTASLRTRRARSTDTASARPPTPIFFQSAATLVVPGALGDLDRGEVARHARARAGSVIGPSYSSS